MEVWLEVKTAADLMGVHPNTVLNRANKDLASRQIPSRGKSGFKYEIALDSLPKEAQERYWENVRLAQAVEAAKPKRGRPSKAAIRKAEAE
ncbi:MAG: hypothetical protein ACI38Q_04405, partial [Candidatus Bruticola sp.]